MMQLQTKLKIENFFNRIQRNFTLMEWAVMFTVISMLIWEFILWVK